MKNHIKITISIPIELNNLIDEIVKESKQTPSKIDLISPSFFGSINFFKKLLSLFLTNENGIIKNKNILITDLTI